MKNLTFVAQVELIRLWVNDASSHSIIPLLSPVCRCLMRVTPQAGVTCSETYLRRLALDDYLYVVDMYVDLSLRRTAHIYMYLIICVRYY